MRMSSSTAPTDFSRFLLVLFLPFTFCLTAADGADRTLAVRMGEPLEVSVPPSDALTEWAVQDLPDKLLEQVEIRKLPAETVFLFRPLARGTGTFRIIKKVVGASGAMSENAWEEIEVMVTDAVIPPAKSDAKARPAARQSPGVARTAAQRRRRGAASELEGIAADTSYAGAGADPLIWEMLNGQLGFPAKNPEPVVLSDTEEAERRRNPLPFSLTYVFPKGSYLLNPTHRLPLPDTPPGVDTAPPAYHQALALARRELYKQAVEVLDGLMVELKAKKQRLLGVEAFYEFVNAHLQMADGNYEDAIKRFKALFNDKFYGRGSRFYAALATEQSGDTLGAISAYQGVISHNPEGYFTPEAAYRIGRLFLNARAYDRAVQEFSDYIRTYPKSPFIDDAIVDLARIYDQIYHHQDFDVALKLYDSLIGDYGESPYLDTIVARKKFIQENYF